MISRPFFSIIIPVYNGGRQFERCLEAVQQSTWTDWELIVVDDGSTDATAEILADLLERPAARSTAATKRTGSAPRV